MTDPAQTPETAEATETVNFLRRFAGLMANGGNAKYLTRAADLLENLTDELAAARDEESLARYKYETATHHADALEAECDALKSDIEGHLNIANAILSERDQLKSKLEERETSLGQLGAISQQERTEFAEKTRAHEEAIAALNTSFDRERETLKAETKAKEQELEEFKEAVSSEKQNLTELRRECEDLRTKIAAFEAKRAEIRAAFERISNLRNETAANADRSDSGTEAALQPAGPLAADETNALVLKATLRQARAQFQFLAKECVVRGDLASQVMCELGAYTMDLALTSGRDADELPVGAVAHDILAAPNPANGRN